MCGNVPRASGEAGVFCPVGDAVQIIVSRSGRVPVWRGQAFENAPTYQRAIRSSRPKNQQPHREHNGEEHEAASKHNEKPVVP